jgi:hypothetical protein
MALPGLPPGWTVTKSLEEVPATNAGTAYSSAPFMRWTFIGRDDGGNWRCASGAEEDCYNQLLSAFQSNIQVTP